MSDFVEVHGMLGGNPHVVAVRSIQSWNAVSFGEFPLCPIGREGDLCTRLRCSLGDGGSDTYIQERPAEIEALLEGAKRSLDVVYRRVEAEAEGQ